MLILREELLALAQLILDLRRELVLALVVLDLLHIGPAKRVDEAGLKYLLGSK